MSQEITTFNGAQLRTRLALSTTARGWDFESSAEYTGPMPDTEGGTRQIVNQLDFVQLLLREKGEAERNLRNQRDGKG